MSLSQLQVFHAGLPVPPEYNPIRILLKHTPRLLEVFPQLRLSENVFTRVLGPVGARVYEYPMPDISFEDIADEGTRLIFDTFVLSFIVIFLYRSTLSLSPMTHRFFTFILSSIIMMWPFFMIPGKALSVSYIRAAIAFRFSLLTWDMFEIRSREEVQKWTFPITYSHLTLLPVEKADLDEFKRVKGYPRNQRLASLKKVPSAALSLVVSQLLLPFFTPRQMLEQQSWPSYLINVFIQGFALYFALASGGNLATSLLGVVLGVEQLPMFENPFFTTNIRTFWSRWNRAIASVLHRIVFGGKNTNIRHASHSTTNEKGKRKDGSVGAAKQQPKPDARFFQKSLQAVLTFFVSGMLHEYLLYFGSPGLYGWQTLFFILNGLMTVLSTYCRKFHPDLVARTPVFVRWLLMMIFFEFVCILFFIPFQRTNMLAEMQMVGQGMLFPRYAQPRRATYVYFLDN